MLKQWLTVLAAVLCLLSGIVGAAAKPVQVWSIFSVEQTRIIQELTDAIFTPNTGIHVEITAIPSSGYEQKYLLAAISNEMPEVAVSGSLGPADMGIRGAVVDLRARYGEDYEKVHQSMYPGLMRSFDFLGSAFGLPTQTNIYPMIVRTDIMNELGLQVPSTWNELYEILPKLQSQGKNFATTFGIGTSVYADASMFIWQRGVDLYTPDRQRSALDTPEAIAAFTEFTELFTKHKIPKEINAYMDFTTGAIPIMLTSVWNYSALVQGAPDLEGKWTLSLVPGTVSADGATNHAAYIGGNSLMLFKRQPCRRRLGVDEVVRFKRNPDRSSSAHASKDQRQYVFAFQPRSHDARAVSRRTCGGFHGAGASVRRSCVCFDTCLCHPQTVQFCHKQSSAPGR